MVPSSVLGIAASWLPVVATRVLGTELQALPQLWVKVEEREREGGVVEGMEQGGL